MKILSVLLLAFNLPCLAGPIASGGGDQYAAEFVQTGHFIVEWLKSTKVPQLDPRITADAFEAAVNTTTVGTTDQPLVLDGATKDAINYPSERRIVISRDAWTRAATAYERNLLVFHEYLGIMGIDDSSYQNSRMIQVVEGPEVQAPPVCLAQANAAGTLLAKINEMNMNSVSYLGRVEVSPDAHEIYSIRLSSEKNRSCYTVRLSSETMCRLVSTSTDQECP